MGWDHQFCRIYFTNVSSGNYFLSNGRLLDCFLWVFTSNPSFLAPLMEMHCLQFLEIQLPIKQTGLYMPQVPLFVFSSPGFLF